MSFILSLALYAVRVMGPIFVSVWMGFTNVDPISRQDWVGIDS